MKKEALTSVMRSLKLLLFFCSLNHQLDAQITNSLRYLKDSSLVNSVSCKAQVLVFLSPECPLCQAYALTLKDLFEEYSGQGFEFLGIISGTSFTAEDANTFKKKYKLPFSFILDTTKKFSKIYNARITPQAIVISKTDSVLYSGRIDNWMYEIGKKRKKPTENSLKDALDDISNHREVKVSKTTAIGCFIE